MTVALQRRGDVAFVVCGAVAQAQSGGPAVAPFQVVEASVADVHAAFAKGTLSEFAAGDTYGSMFGVTRNPYDPARTAGGSSGGSGAALAAHLSTLALGEETAASIRRPGGWNALVTLRPTPGLVSRTGMWDGYPTTPAQVGPMARTVTDLAALLDVMVGYDPEDPLTALGVTVKHIPYSVIRELPL